MTGVASGPSENEVREFILESIEVYKWLPDLWDLNPRNTVTVRQKDTYAILLDKYRDRYPEADRQNGTKNFNSFRTNFRKIKTIDNSVKSGAR
jgi:hypothetical protein